MFFFLSNNGLLATTLKNKAEKGSLTSSSLHSKAANPYS